MWKCYIEYIELYKFKRSRHRHRQHHIFIYLFDRFALDCAIFFCKWCVIVCKCNALISFRFIVFALSLSCFLFHTSHSFIRSFIFAFISFDDHGFWLNWYKRHWIRLSFFTLICFINNNNIKKSFVIHLFFIFFFFQIEKFSIFSNFSHLNADAYTYMWNLRDLIFADACVCVFSRKKLCYVWGPRKYLREV